MRQLVWVVYDITSDRARARAAASCLRLGLERVQKSVFIGIVDPSRLDEMMMALEAQIDPRTDSIYAFPFSVAEFNAVRVAGAALNRVRVLDQELVRCL